MAGIKPAMTNLCARSTLRRHSTRHPVENHQALWNKRPRRPARREDRNSRLEQRGIVERAGIDRVRVIFADASAEDEAAADRAMVSNRLGAADRLRDRFAGLAAETDRVR